MLGADIAELRAALGAVMDDGATLGLSSSLLGTLDPLAMPGGFRPFDLRQPDLLVWVEGPDARSCAEAADTVVGFLAGPTALRRRTLGTVRTPRAGGPVPVLADGPAAGGTYVILVAGPDDGGSRPGPDLVIEPLGTLDAVDAGDGGDPTSIWLRADLGVLGDLDDRTVAHGGLYLVVDLSTARRLTAAARG